MRSGFISEIYTSVQGEGPYTGLRQIFVRLAGCPLRCLYCDTPGSLTSAGHRRVSSDQVVAQICELADLASINWVSVTGGEPLAHVPFLAELFPRLKKKAFKIYLETAGIHAAGLKKCEPYIDVIAMDLKMPSAVGRAYWKEHEQFLRVGFRKAFVKVVIDHSTSLQEILKACDVLKPYQSFIQLILQPATPQAPNCKAPSIDQIAQYFELAKSLLKHVLVMPQQHKLWSIR